MYVKCVTEMNFVYIYKNTALLQTLLKRKPTSQVGTNKLGHYQSNLDQRFLSMVIKEETERIGE
jgi:hypothetical protein